MQNQFEDNVFRRYLFLCTLAAMFFFVFNPQGLNFAYGSGNGRYADRVDSFSEYIVRNTIKRNVLNKDDSSLIPIVTKGYESGNYEYNPDGYTKYSSNLAFQTIPATILAKAFRLNTEAKLDRFLGILRLANALLLSVFTVGILLSYCSYQKINFAFLTPFLVGCSSGFIYFSQNLYFSSALIVLPAFYIAIQLRHRQKFNKYLVFLFGIFYFLRGFEFSTVFALLTAFSAALFTSGSLTQKMKMSAAAFVLICLAFAASIILQIIFLSADNNSSLRETAQALYYNIQHRTQSIDGVPLPFSTKFIKIMNERWNYPAFSVNESGFALSQANIIIMMMLGALFRLSRITDNEKIIYSYGLLGYASWYVFAYQHIMWHSMYDWYIFSLTMGLSFGLLFIFYGSLAVEYFQRLYFVGAAKEDLK